MNNIEQQFLQLVQIMENMQQRIASLEQTNQVLLRSNNQLIEVLEEQKKELEAYQRNLFFELNAPKSDMHDFWYPSIQSTNETIEQIVNHGKSLARFGDGEFAAIQGRIRHRFQTEIDEGLKQRLLEVLQSEEENLLIGIADNYGSLEKYTEQAKREIRRYMNPQVRKEHLGLLNPQKTYYDAYVTRPYVMYADSQTDAPEKRFEDLQRIWANRDCVFVEGCYTRLGIGNDLFDNAGSIQRILGPAENAFSKYQEILDFCTKQKKDTLFLLALGPTASVLAYDLCKAGYQAVDVGHVDLEYEWYLRGEGRRIPIEGKYNNELGEEQQLFPLRDEVYLSQMIADFSQN